MHFEGDQLQEDVISKIGHQTLEDDSQVVQHGNENSVICVEDLFFIQLRFSNTIVDLRLPQGNIRLPSFPRNSPEKDKPSDEGTVDQDFREHTLVFFCRLLHKIQYCPICVVY